MKTIHAKKLVSRIISVPPAHREAASATEERRSAMATMANSASIVPKNVGAALQPLPQLACIVWRGVGRTECSPALIWWDMKSIQPREPTLLRSRCFFFRGIFRSVFEKLSGEAGGTLQLSVHKRFSSVMLARGRGRVGVVAFIAVAMGGLQVPMALVYALRLHPAR